MADTTVATVATTAMLRIRGAGATDNVQGGWAGLLRQQSSAGLLASSGGGSGLAPTAPSADGGKARIASGVIAAWWNARNWNGSGEKWKWLKARLDEHEVDVVMLYEMTLTSARFKSLAAAAKRSGYHAKRLHGTGEGGAGGIVCMLRCAVAKYTSELRRLGPRVLAVSIRHVRWKGELRLGGLHGLTGGKEGTFAQQVRGLQLDVDKNGPLTVMADWNHVPCAAWWANGGCMSSGDKLVRSLGEWECSCCAVEEGGAGRIRGRIVGGSGQGGEAVSWTRYHTTDLKWAGPTSRIDYAIELGGGPRWRALPSIAAECQDAKGETCALSDHLMQLMVLEVVDKGDGSERRPTGVRAGRQGTGPAVRKALSEALREEGLADHLDDLAEAAGRQGESELRPVAKAMVDMGKCAEATVETKHRVMAGAAVRLRGGLSGPRQRYFDWKAMLHHALRLRARGAVASEVRRGPLFHHARGLREQLQEGWRAVVARCRREVDRAAKHMQAAKDRDVRALEAGAAALLKLPADALEERERAAWKLIYRERGSAAMDGMYERDDKSQKWVHCSEARFARVSRQVGELFVSKLDRGEVPAASEAWHDIFVGHMPEVDALDGLEWQVRKECTFKVFLSCVAKFPVKAAGAGGFSIQLLKLAPRKVQCVFWRALIRDVTSGNIDADWRRVMYVLLVKPAPNDADVVSERREIALMAQEMKLLLQMIRRTCYARVAGRMHKSAMGWLATYGCADLGIAAAHITDQARVLQHGLYMLYLDLATFFPKIQRQGLRVAELVHGLPRVVVDLAVLIYGAGRGDPGCVSCQYDTSAGLGGSFSNYMGALMGCVLSTEKARIFLNGVVTAVFAVARGVRLWGCGNGDAARAWEELCQLVCADDWLGCFTRPKEAKRAWAILSAWEPMTGAEIGIKQAAKTVLTGVRWGPGGKARRIGLLRLVTADGREVPITSPHVAYKHLGRMRRADGSCATERQVFFKKVKHAIATINGMKQPSRRALMLVSEALLVGLSGFYLQTLHITWDEAEKLEAGWRRVANRHLGRRRDTPRLEFYLPGGGRTHIFAVNLSAKLGAGCRAMSDMDATPQRGAARSALAMAAATWGCRDDPATWRWQHIAVELEKAMAHPHHRTYGEGLMLAWVLCEGQASNDDDEEAKYLRDQPRLRDLIDGAALRKTAPHFKEPCTRMLSGERGLGILSSAAVLRNGVASVGHMCGRRVDGVVEVMSSAAAVARGIQLNTTEERASWDRCAADLRDETRRQGIALEVERRIRLRDAWADSSGEGGVDVQMEAVARLKAALRAEAESSKRGASSVGRQGWEVRLRGAFPAVPAPQPREWAHGITDARDIARGTRYVRFQTGVDAYTVSGGEGNWMTQSRDAGGLDLDREGFVIGWQDEATRLRDELSVDSQGYICWATGERVTATECNQLLPMIQLLARARLALGDAEVTHGEPEKRAKVTVNVPTVVANLADACKWQARMRVTEAYATDGGMVTVTKQCGEKEITVVVAAYAVVKHDGSVYGGVISNSLSDPVAQQLGLKGTSYLAELAAQLKCSSECARGARVAVWYDSQSVVSAGDSYRHAHARRAREKYARGWLSALAAQEERVEVKVSGWQRSHTGSPPNEWVDRMVDRYAQDFEEYAKEVRAGYAPQGGLEPRWADATSMLFPAARTSMLRWAQPYADRLVRARLREAVHHTVLRRDTDAVLGVLPDQEVRALNAAAARRWALADEGGFRRTEARDWRRRCRCPAGCDAPCDAYHFVYECQHVEARGLRRELEGTLHDLAVHGEVACDMGVHTEVRFVQQMLKKGVSADGWLPDMRRQLSSGDAKLSVGQTKLTRAMSGMYDAGSGGKAMRQLATRAASLAARLLLAGKHLTAALDTEATKRETAQGVFRRYVTRLAASVASGGSLRAARLRMAWHCNLQVRGWATRASNGRELLNAWAPHRSALVARAQRVSIEERGGPQQQAQAWLQWWATARLLAWRLRARATARLRAWVEGVVDQDAHLHGMLCAEGLASTHGGAVIRCAAFIQRCRGHRWLRPDVDGELGITCEAAEARAPQELLAWAGSVCDCQLEWDMGSSSEREDHWRERAVAAGLRERATRGAGRSELCARKSRWLHQWMEDDATPGGTGAVNRPFGSWDAPTSAEKSRAVRRIRKRDRYRASRGLAKDQNGTWGYQDVLRIRVSLPGNKRRLEALVRWSGDWGAEADTWLPISRAYFPCKALRERLMARFREEHEWSAIEQGEWSGCEEQTAAPRVAARRIQPLRAAATGRVSLTPLELAEHRMVVAQERRKVAIGRHRKAQAKLGAARQKTATAWVICRIAERHRRTQKAGRRGKGRGDESEEESESMECGKP